MTRARDKAVKRQPKRTPPSRVVVRDRRARGQCGRVRARAGVGARGCGRVVWRVGACAGGGGTHRRRVGRGGALITRSRARGSNVERTPPARSTTRYRQPPAYTRSRGGGGGVWGACGGAPTRAARGSLTCGAPRNPDARRRACTERSGGGSQNLAPPAGGVMARKPPPSIRERTQQQRLLAGHALASASGPRPISLWGAPPRQKPTSWVGARTWHADQGWRRRVTRAPAPSSPPLGADWCRPDCVAGTGGWCPPVRRVPLSQPWAPSGQMGARAPVGAQSRGRVTRRVFAGPGRPARPSAVAACRPPCGARPPRGKGSAGEDQAAEVPPCAPDWASARGSNALSWRPNQWPGTREEYKRGTVCARKLQNPGQLEVPHANSAGVSPDMG